MDLLCHHQTYFVTFKVFRGLLDVAEVINISLLMPLTYLLFLFGGGTMTKATLHGYPFTGIFVYIYFF